MEFRDKIENLIQELNIKKTLVCNELRDFTISGLDKLYDSPNYLEVGKVFGIIDRVPVFIPFISESGFNIYISSETSADSYNKYIKFILLQIIFKTSPNILELNIYDPVYLGTNYNSIIKEVSENDSIKILANENELYLSLINFINSTKELTLNQLVNYKNFLEYWGTSNDKDKKLVVYLFNNMEFIKNNNIVELISRIYTNSANNNSFFIFISNNSDKEIFKFYNKIELKYYVSQNLYPFYKKLKIDLELDKLDEKINKYSQSISKLNESKEINQNIYNISEGINIPIGINTKTNKTFYFKLGFNTDCYNAIIGGQPGKGKSVLLDTIIKRSFQIYNSDDLKFMLFDCKGVEFNDFEINNYIIARESTPEISVIIEKLNMINEEFEKRRELFKTNNVKSIDQLVAKGVKLYRLICIIDEFQFLFPLSDYKTTQFSEDLLINKILRTGRSFGIHLIVATQSLGDGVKASILNNIPLRIALGMTEWQSASFLASNNTAAKNLERGSAIYNSSNGELSANVLINIDKID